MIVLVGGSGYLFYFRWSKIQQEQENMEQVLIESQKQAETIIRAQQEKKSAEQKMLETADMTTLTNVRIVDELVKRYHVKAGYVPSMAGHLSLVEQGLGYSEPLPEEKEPRIRGVRYTWKGGNAYELCAEFKTSTLLEGIPKEWGHGIGNQCFDRSIGSSVVNEIKSTL